MQKTATTKKLYNCYRKCYTVRDHCHFTEKYRGAAHDICYLRYKIPKHFQ